MTFPTYKFDPARPQVGPLRLTRFGEQVLDLTTNKVRIYDGKYWFTRYEDDLPFTCVVTGGRNYKDIECVRIWLARLPPLSKVVHGGAQGADSLAHEVAQSLGFEVEVYEASWDVWGKDAGKIRNQVMLEGSVPCTLLVFPGGHGTLDMVNRAAKRKDVRIIFTRGEEPKEDWP